MWKQILKRGTLARVVLTISSVVVLVTGVTFAALQSQQVMLTGNSISTASAGLLIGTASATSTAYGATHSGFNFNGVIPGGPPMPAGGNVFYLKNNGSSPLTLRVSVGSVPTNANSSVDLRKVFVTVTRTDSGNSKTIDLQSMIDGFPLGGMTLDDVLAPASTGVQYTIAVSMTTDAFTGNSATVGSIDFVFTGTAATATPA